MVTATISSGVVLVVIVLGVSLMVLAVAWGAASGRDALQTLPDPRKRRR